MCFVPKICVSDFEKAVKQSIRAKFEGITLQGNKSNSRFWRSPAAAAASSLRFSFALVQLKRSSSLRSSSHLTGLYEMFFIMLKLLFFSTKWASCLSKASTRAVIILKIRVKCVPIFSLVQVKGGLILGTVTLMKRYSCNNSC